MQLTAPASYACSLLIVLFARAPRRSVGCALRLYRGKTSSRSCTIEESYGKHRKRLIVAHHAPDVKRLNNGEHYNILCTDLVMAADSQQRKIKVDLVHSFALELHTGGPDLQKKKCMSMHVPRKKEPTTRSRTSLHPTSCYFICSVVANDRQPRAVAG